MDGRATMLLCPCESRALASRASAIELACDLIKVHEQHHPRHSSHFLTITDTPPTVTTRLFLSEDYYGAQE
jgi:hypothetical protein